MAEETASTSYVPMLPTKRQKLLLRVLYMETKTNKDGSKPQPSCGPPGGGSCFLPPCLLLSLAPLSEMSQCRGGGTQDGVF